MEMGAHDFAGIKGPDKGGFMEDIRRYAEKRTGTRSLLRFMLQGTIFTLFTGFPTALGSFVRPLVYRALMAGVGSGCFIEKNVKLNTPQRVTFGDRVMVGEGTIFDVVEPRSRIVVGDDVKIPRYCTLRACPGDITIGSKVNIGTFSFLAGYGGLSMGDKVAIASHVVIMTYLHGFSDRSVAIRDQDVELRPVVIEENVWIGTHALIMPGVRIGTGSVIGAGSVVTKDIPPYSVAVGSPARVIKER